MVVDSGTVRLVICLGMFLVFAGDYSTLVATIFGKEQADRGVVQDPSRRGSKGPSGKGPREFDRMVFGVDDEEAVEEPENEATRKAKLMATIKSACLPKLICELTASPHKDQLSEMERSLLNLIRDTTLSTTAGVGSRYHFAAHMGQLIAGIEGQGCHNFYPGCPLPRSSVLNMMKKIRQR